MARCAAWGVLLGSLGVILWQVFQRNALPGVVAYGCLCAFAAWTWIMWDAYKREEGARGSKDSRDWRSR